LNKDCSSFEDSARFLCRTVFRPECNNDGGKRNWHLNYNDTIGQIHRQNQG
jgi:hypothetical protein